MFLCRVRKSLKGQVFCLCDSCDCLSRLYKHNLCRVGRLLREDCGRHKSYAPCQHLQKNSKC
jgi:hypothetical protein